jgi:hypothetical protein
VPGFLYLGSARDAEDEAQLQTYARVSSLPSSWSGRNH